MCTKKYVLNMHSLVYPRSWQLQQSGSNENRNYDLNSDQASQSNQRQTDVNDKHGISLDSNGR